MLSGGKSGATEQRARYLGIGHCLPGVKDKPRALLDLQHKLSVAIESTAYVGDDLNDLVVRPLVRLLVSPEDGVKALRRKCDWVLNQKGGDCAVRAVAEAILEAKEHCQVAARKGWFDKNG